MYKGTGTRIRSKERGVNKAVLRSRSGDAALAPLPKLRSPSGDAAPAPLPKLRSRSGDAALAPLPKLRRRSRLKGPATFGQCFGSAYVLYIGGPLWIYINPDPGGKKGRNITRLPALYCRLSWRSKSRDF